MKAFFLAVAVVLLAVAVDAGNKEEVIEKSKQLMDKYMQDVIDELKKLKSEGKSYTAKDVEPLAATISVEKLTKYMGEFTGLAQELKEVQKSGDLVDFQLYKQGSAALKTELNQAVKDLIKKDELSPRFIGTLLVDGTAMLTDVVRVLLTRYTPVSQMAH